MTPLPKEPKRPRPDARLPFLLLGGALACALIGGGCSCGSDDLPVSVFTDARYTPDGRALLLEANDGLWASVPAGEAPKLVSDGHCSFSSTHSLDCVRISPDSRRFALLAFSGVNRPGKLSVFAFGRDEAEGEILGGEVADGVLDAAFSQDGSELFFVGTGPAEKTVSVHRLLPGGLVQPLVPSIDIGPAPVKAAGGSVVVTPFGVAYPGRDLSGVSVWFQPLEGEPVRMGLLPERCDGAQLARCVAATPDGTALVWQERDGGVLHAFRAQPQVDLPLGRGYGLDFAGSGNLALRMSPYPVLASVQRLDTAAEVRVALGALSAQLSTDGESLLYLLVETEMLQTYRLKVGPVRANEPDRDLGVLQGGGGRPLAVSAVGVADLDVAFTGDGRFVLAAEATGQPGVSRIQAISTSTQEKRELGTFNCTGCCLPAPAGALMACAPTATDGEPDGPAPVVLYDPATGKRTVVAQKVVLAEPIFDGSGMAALDYSGEVPELVVATKDGRVTRMGKALRFALSPVGPQVAILDELGSLRVERLP